MGDLYQVPEADLSEDKVHPAEFYVKPALGTDPQLGDLRLIDDRLCVVIWPSCDLVTRANGKRKVDQALCAMTSPLANSREVKKWTGNQSNSAKGELLALLRNERKGKGVQEQRYHFLPGAWDIPASVVDFQELVHVDVKTLAESSCVATLASPFAEALSVRFTRYVGRVGTPDLDFDSLIEDLTPQ